ncbi:MAG: hypothetical protein RDU14_01065 [Melioribacteraceae bacterium]|nr:hypothetical protein [Melioribacteraceae bacterium]
MDFSEETLKIIAEVEELSRSRLNFKEDLQRLIELSILNQSMKNLEDLSFKAKYSQGLLKIIQNRDNKIEDEYFVKVQNEFMESVQKIKVNLETILSPSSEFIKQIFSEKYFQMTQQSLTNLNLLCNDLGFVKIYFNDLKRL